MKFRYYFDNNIFFFRIGGLVKKIVVRLFLML